MSELKWTKYWRVTDGDVRYEDAFSYPDDPDYVYFGEDPRWESDSTFGRDAVQLHVDDIAEGNGVFENEEDAKKYAIEWMNKKIFEYQLKLARLQGTNKVSG